MFRLLLAEVELNFVCNTIMIRWLVLAWAPCILIEVAQRFIISNVDVFDHADRILLIIIIFCHKHVINAPFYHP